MSFEINLSGFYQQGADVVTTCKVTIYANGQISGSGSDAVGPYNMSGTFYGNDIRFVKSYTNANIRWDYIGKRTPTGEEKIFQLSGFWGYNSYTPSGGWVLCGIASGEIPKPIDDRKPFEGTWDGIFFYGANNTPDTSSISTWSIYLAPY